MGAVLAAISAARYHRRVNGFGAAGDLCPDGTPCPGGDCNGCASDMPPAATGPVGPTLSCLCNDGVTPCPGNQPSACPGPGTTIVQQSGGGFVQAPPVMQGGGTYVQPGAGTSVWSQIGLAVGGVVQGLTGGPRPVPVVGSSSMIPIFLIGAGLLVGGILLVKGSKHPAPAVAGYRRRRRRHTGRRYHRRAA